MLNGAKKPVQLPVAHDALTARLIELAGFDAYQIGGYALSGASQAIPDVDLEKFGEKNMPRKISFAPHRCRYWLILMTDMAMLKM